MVLLVDFFPSLRVNSEQALPGFFNGNGVLGRETITIELVLTSSTVLLGFRSQDSCDFRLKGIPAEEPLK